MRTIFAGFLMMMAVAQVHADELHLIVDGKAYHMTNRNYNEKNYGLGFEYDLAQSKNWIHFINGSTFKDSLKNTSNYLGAGMKRRYKLQDNTNGWHVDVGFFAFLMTRKDYHDNHPFPGVLPIVSLGKQWFAINATFIPKVSPKHVNLFFFQLMFRLAEF
jgi:palmitoyl transferase